MKYVRADFKRRVGGVIDIYNDINGFFDRYMSKQIFIIKWS